MKTLHEHLAELQKIKRPVHHPLVHEIHKKFRLSRKTLFYIKEYGPHTHVAKTIIKGSVKILIFASLVSSFGGLALEHIKLIFVSIIPLTILLPTLNDMIGDFGTVVSSRFSAMLHEGKIKKADFSNPEVKVLISQVLVTAILTGLLSAAAAIILSFFTNNPPDLAITAKIFLITLLDVLVLVGILSVTSVYAGLYFFRKGEDPNNLLIPITTSVADFGNIVILAILVTLLF